MSLGRSRKQVAVDNPTAADPRSCSCGSTFDLDLVRGRNTHNSPETVYGECTRTVNVLNQYRLSDNEFVSCEQRQGSSEASAYQPICDVTDEPSREGGELHITTTRLKHHTLPPSA